MVAAFFFAYAIDNCAVVHYMNSDDLFSALWVCD